MRPRKKKKIEVANGAGGISTEVEKATAQEVCRTLVKGMGRSQCCQTNVGVGKNRQWLTVEEKCMGF